MSTRSRIGIQLEDGRYKSIYCHWDGYPEHQLPLLNKNYNELEKVEALLNLGDISVLGELISPDDKKEHSFDNPQLGVTLAYGRDRGETNVSAKITTTLPKLEEYTYIFLPEKQSWIYYS